MTVPVFQAAGSIAESTGAAVAPAWPTHQIGDIGFLILEASGNSPAPSTPTNWTNLCDLRDINTTAGSRFNVYWRRATSSAMTAPTTDSQTDHCLAVICTVRGALPAGTPIDASATGGKGTNFTGVASTTATLPTVTTTVDECLILLLCCRPDDSASTAHFGTPSNGALTGLDSTQEFGTIQGNGGGFVFAYGIKSVAGVVGTTTMTKSASTTDLYCVLAIPPPQLKTVNGLARASINTVGGQPVYGVRSLGRVT